MHTFPLPLSPKEGKGQAKMTDLVLAPDADSNFKVTLKELAGGRLKPLHLWPATHLVTLAGRLAGYENYEDSMYVGGCL